MAALTDRYKSFAELRSSEPEKLAYRFQVVKRHTGLAIIAPHGGGIEPGTSEIARAIASNRFSFYAFEGLKKEGNEVLHITSALFDEPGCLRLLNDSDFAVAIHGCSGSEYTIFLGGLHDGIKTCLMNALTKAGFDARLAGGEYTGKQLQNICNRGRSGRGVQVEISEGLRRAMFRGFDRQGRKVTTELFRKFVAVVYDGLVTITEEMGS